MPWWSWWVLWGVLVLALVGMLAFFAVSLFRKSMSAFAEFDRLTDALSALDVNLDDIAPGRKPSAVFQEHAQLALVVERNREARSVKKQQHRDARLSRGKLLIRSTENWTPPHA